MPRGLRSPVWYDLPGVVGAYQFAGAPSYPDALRNVNSARSAENTLSDPVPPTLNYFGMYFNGSTQYLDTGLLANWNVSRLKYDRSVIVRFAYASYPNISHRAIGVHYDVDQAFGIGKHYVGSVHNGSSSGLGATPATATIGVDTSGEYYWNGVYIATAPAGMQGNSSRTMLIGASNSNAGSAALFWKGYIMAVLIVDRYMSQSEFVLATHQMQNCEFNPAWNAWARQRRYYYRAAATGIARQRVNSGLISGRGTVNGGLIA